MSRHAFYIRSPIRRNTELKETSPTSDEFTEEDLYSSIPIRIGSSQSWVASSTTKLSTAYLPHLSEIHMEIKNPLTSRNRPVLPKTFETHDDKLAKQLKQLESEKQTSKERINKLEKEAQETRRLRIVLREKDKEIQNLRISLELTMHESNELKHELAEKCSLRSARRSNDKESESISNSYEGGPIHTHEFYSYTMPRRYWHDPCPNITELFESFETNLRSLLREN